MITRFHNRQIEISEIDHGTDSIDSIVGNAYWLDSGEPLDDNDLEDLTEQLHSTGDLHEEWWQDKLD